MYQDQLELPLLHAGKIRELYAVDGDRLLMVATDKISAFDFVLEPTVPDKGAILNQLSLWWFDRLGRRGRQSRAVDRRAGAGSRPGGDLRAARDDPGRVCRPRLPDRLGVAEYQRSGTVCGIELPTGLVDGSRLPEPIFTPATKAALGEHDENVDSRPWPRRSAHEVAARIRELTLAVYAEAEVTARERGLILADTKFEFGTDPDGTIVLADEVLTPDSSRFWDADDLGTGSRRASYDKQFVRTGCSPASGWDRTSGSRRPPLPRRRRRRDPGEVRRGVRDPDRHPLHAQLLALFSRARISEPRGSFR